MSQNEKGSQLDDRLHQVARDVIIASANGDAQAESASSSPFLYARLRTRINAERERRTEGERWLTLASVLWRAVPTMALVTVFAVVMFFAARINTPSNGGFTDEAFLGTREAEVEQVVFADNQTLSSDDVLATIFDDDEREASR